MGKWVPDGKGGWKQGQVQKDMVCLMLLSRSLSLVRQVVVLQSCAGYGEGSGFHALTAKDRELAGSRVIITRSRLLL